MEKPIEQYSDNELLAVIRRAENTTISGSLFQRAQNEWSLRNENKKKIPVWKTVLIGVAIGVIAPMILYFIFGIGKSALPQKQTNTNSPKSPLIQNSSNISIVYSETNSGDPFPQKINFSMDPLFPESKYDFARVEMVLPDKEILFIPEVSHNHQYPIFETNKDFSDFLVSKQYRITDNFDKQNICFIATFPSPPTFSINFDKGPDYNKNNDCYNLISGINSLEKIWGN